MATPRAVWLGLSAFIQEGSRLTGRSRVVRHPVGWLGAMTPGSRGLLLQGPALPARLGRVREVRLGAHFDVQGRVALTGMETAEYTELAASAATVKAAMRSRR